MAEGAHVRLRGSAGVHHGDVRVVRLVLREAEDIDAQGADDVLV